MILLWFLISSIIPFYSVRHLYQSCKLSLEMLCNHVLGQEINIMKGWCLNKRFYMHVMCLCRFKILFANVWMLLKWSCVHDSIYIIDALSFMSCEFVHCHWSHPLLHVVAARLGWDTLLSGAGWKCQCVPRLHRTPLLATTLEPGSCPRDLTPRQQLGSWYKV